MVSPNTQFSSVLLFFIMFLYSLAEVKGQCNPEEGGATCQTAPIVCLNNLCDGTEVNPPDGAYNGWCGNNTAIHNPQYFAFIATSTQVQFTVTVGNCTGGQNAIQAAILGSCPWTGANEILDCANNIPSGQTFVLEAQGLVIGNTYYLVFDGSAGAQCEYTIEEALGVYEPQLENDLESVTVHPDEPVCQGYIGMTFNAEPEVVGAHGYWWTAEWAPLDTIETTDPELTINIPAQLDPGTYEICVQAFSGCDIGEALPCITIEVYEIPEEEKPSETFCPEEFPFSWGSVNISGPNEYTQTFTTPEGCAFDSIWVVEEYPEVPLGILDTLHCFVPLLYEGVEIYDPGTYEFSYPGMGLNGCDSTAELNVTLAAIEAYIELTCENGEFALTVVVEDLLPVNADLEYQWYDGSTPWPDMQNVIYVLEGGVYRCFVTVITPAGECIFELEPFAFDAEDYKPDPPNLGFTDTLVCAQSGIFFEVIVDPFEDPFTYTWSGPANVPIFQDGSPIAEFDFTSSGPAEICVYATNDCGDGPPFCFMVDIQATPDASFTHELDVCADSTTIVTFTGSASGNAEVLWDFDSPTTVSGTGIGPYTLSWAVPGDKLISLTVIEPGCDTAFNSGIISVTSFQAPVVNCSSTISSVLFNWNDVIGASGYLVSIDNGPAVPTALSEWMVSPLTPGTVVTLTLTVISAGACDDIVVTAMCTAEDCPAPTIDITGQDSACLNNPTIIDLDALVNGNPDPGTWAGNGIIDPVLGLFDPKVATSGQHPITFTVDVNGCPFTSEPYLITVFDSLTADFVLDPLICITDVAGLTYTGNASSGAVYDYNFGAATVVAGTGAGPYQLSWASPGNKTVRLQVSENGCISDIVSHTTDVIATLNAPVINCSPNTSGILFSWSIDPASAGFVVNTLIGPPGVPVGTDSLDFPGLTPGDIVEIEIVTLSSGPCPDRRDTLQCIARECPMPVIVIEPVLDICLYPGTLPIDLDVTVTNGAGSGSWSGPGITDPVNGIFDPVVAGAGAHQISYNYSDDGCNFIESITINVYDVPEAFISNVDLLITCTSGPIILDASTSSGGPLDFLWSTDDGALGAGAATAYAEATSPGLYQVLVSNSISGCKDSTSVTVTQDSNIPTADAGPDKTITCDSLEFTLGGASTTGVNVTYSWSTALGGNIVGPTNGQKITGNSVGEYIIVVRDTVTGCQSTDRAMIDIDTAVATIILTAGDTIDCNTAVTTATSMLSEPLADYNLNWTTNDGTFVGGTTGPDISVSQGGTYTLSIEHKLNGCENSESVFIPESDEIINGVDVSLMNIVCHGEDNGALTINNVMGGTGPYTYQWTGSAQGGTMLTSLAPGTYTLIVSDANGCSFTETYQITEPDLVTINVGPDQTVPVDDTVTLNITTNLTPGAISTIDWSGYEGLVCPGCPTFKFVAVSSSTITAMISDTSGCSAADSMRLTVIVPRIIYIPNVFSPNDDGNNDNFFISGKRNLTHINYLRIYDRWGNLVFENIDLTPGVETEGWDGSFNGEMMLPGVYVYLAELLYEDGFEEIVTGDITIIR
jgi:gliding motility-associated-like protein